MDAEEVKERVTALERQKARDGRIDWYDRNAPVWWKNLKDLFNDPVWGEDLDNYCVKWFGHSEAETAEFLGLEKVPEAELEKDPVKKERPGYGSLSITEQIMEKKKVKTAAERAKAYRERRKAGK